MTDLRPHQEIAVEALRQSLRKGNMRPLLAAPCSMGKTMIAAHIMMNAAEKGIRSVFFCDRIKLVSQTTDTFGRLGASYSVLQGDDPRYDPSKLIQIASIQTAVRRNHLPFGLAIAQMAGSLQSKGMDGDVNAAKFWLSHQAGWTETKRTEVTGRDGDPIEVDMHWTVEVVE